ncbi:hypothetical protein HII31_05699 [Pseudocercospora fuligena]|uniref:Uncharacterized protein n=1 Tax=Pseudocercospora fuligena TaxID=685502 RepID=A0A8H6RLC2_9PEZI|nr:hypothetical protein HII31_05699 [Pseudocercospora fuligena]
MIPYTFLPASENSLWWLGGMTTLQQLYSAAHIGFLLVRSCCYTRDWLGRPIRQISSQINGENYVPAWAQIWSISGDGTRD